MYVCVCVRKRHKDAKHIERFYRSIELKKERVMLLVSKKAIIIVDEKPI